MSIHPLNAIEDYWSTEMFLGCPDFPNIMSRNQFTNIRAHLKLTAPTVLAQDNDNGLDPLWHSRSMLQHFQSNIVKLAVSTGGSALDECTVWTKACTCARSYIKGKPHPYGIQFYAVVSSKHNYLFSLWDNGSGNKTGIHPVTNYTNLYCDLATPVNKVFSGTTGITKENPSVL